ncbi:unnamed protein product [Parnassius apollo]|uniref:(apollo) hypothetical protein n=1 Tax=Parnassius apollo TaxID=110799 RepID=A0A8S3XE95_PARAO|nr:unnamed protein product [Parnassius apollo]
MDGSMPSETCIRLLKEKLSEFELSLDRDIVAIVIDGASVMLKVGRNLRACHQVCLAHGIQLAVFDVLYKQGGAENVRSPDTAVTAGGSESDSEFENDADSAEDETGGFEVIPVVSNPNELNNDYKSVISKYLQNLETYFSEVATAEFPKTPEMVEEIYSLNQNFEGEPVVRVMDDLALDNSASSNYLQIEKCEDLSSDHTPVILNTYKQAIFLKPLLKIYNKHTNWDQYREFIRSNIDLNISLKTNDEIEAGVDSTALYTWLPPFPLLKIGNQKQNKRNPPET